MCVAGSRSMSVSYGELCRSRLLYQMIGGVRHQMSLRLPCGYLEAWLAFVRCPLQGGSPIRSMHASVAMLNVRCVSYRRFRENCRPSVFIECIVHRFRHNALLLQWRKHNKHRTRELNELRCPSHCAQRNRMLSAQQH